MPSIHTVWQNYKLAHPNSLYHLFIIFKTKGNLNDHSKELVAMVWNINGPHNARILTVSQMVMLSIDRRQNRNSWYIANVLGDCGTFQTWELAMRRKWLRMGPWSLPCFLFPGPLWYEEPPYSTLVAMIKTVSMSPPTYYALKLKINLSSSTVSVMLLGQSYMKLIITVGNIKVCQ